MSWLWLIGIVIVLLMILAYAVRIAREYERYVVFRLGRFVGVRGPGVVLIIPLVERVVKVDLRVFVVDVPPQDAITMDNVPVGVNAVVYARVFNPEKAILEVENYGYATSQISQTTLRSVIGKASLDKILSEREKVNSELQGVIDKETDPWGLKVSTVEVKDVKIPESMYRAMARQAEAERDRRGRIILADAELQASKKLKEAAEIISKSPRALQLRYLQTIAEIATEKSATIVVPMEFANIFKLGDDKKK